LQQITQTPRVHFSVFQNELVVFYGQEQDAKTQTVDYQTVRFFIYYFLLKFTLVQVLRYFKGDAGTTDEKVRQEVQCVNIKAQEADAELISKSFGASLVK
jgi:hypothetical protein